MKTQRWIESFEDSFRITYGENSLSPRFAYLMAAKLAEDFFKKTGIDVIKANRKILLFQAPYFCKVFSGEETGQIEAGIAVFHYVSDAVISWQGKNGKTILPSDPSINDDDISFWFEKLAVESIRRDYAKITRKQVIFDSAKFRFAVEYDTFSWDGLYFQFFYKGDSEVAAKLEQMVDELVSSWNEKSEQTEGSQGYIHNTSISKPEPGLLEYYLDLGSAISKFLEQFLLSLNQAEGLEKVRVTSYP